MKQAFPHSGKTMPTGQVDNHEKPIGRAFTNRSHPDVSTKRDPQTDDSNPDQIAPEQEEVNKIKELPKEVGVMLVTAGIVGFVLPGPGIPAIIAGGLVLWPKAFGKLESWLERRHPRVHRQSMKQINRFLNDLEKRYPHSSDSCSG